MIDSHIHLSDKKFDLDRDKIIANSINDGILTFIEVLCSKFEWEKTTYFDKYNNFLFSLGIHPHYFKQTLDQDIKKLETLIKCNKKIIAVGEIGIDLWYYPQNLKEQIDLMLKQINIANINKKIIIFHIRNPKDSTKAYDEFFNVTKNIINTKVILHSFSGSYDDAKKAIDRGFYIGINATITYPKNTYLREIIKKIPLSYILTETDSPYLPPQRIRGKRNEPSSIKDIIETIAEVLNTDFKTIETHIEKNFKMLIN